MQCQSLDADVLLPPRKRLLTGLKKQSLDGDSVPCSSFSGSASTSFVDPSSLPNFSYNDFNNRLKCLVSSYPKKIILTPEEIIETWKLAAASAMKVAKAARAAAEEKAAMAAKATAAAKSALDLAASFSDEAGIKERNVKKNRLKKHLPVHLLYQKYQPVENCGTDEELARKLHLAINSSPRISKNCSNPDLKNHKYNKRKVSISYEIAGVAAGGKELGQGHLPLCNGHARTSKADSEETIQDMFSSKDKRKNKFEKSREMDIDDEEAESSFSEEQNWGDTFFVGKKRGSIKLRRLPLSFCTTKDKTQAKEETHSASPPSTEINKANHPAASLQLFPVYPSSDGPTPMEATSTCKSHDFKKPVCINQNKFVQP